ncbi:major facilitator superfamily domain-containing protein 4A-like [Haliotis rubra]|uniref:major facilitator superfamily domain-containing protein 4A-like n=1 Tax=Haliotis rubra TaxID=36100 RepID=UPI001EE60F36|nr:major facilitator superfamily domain-containing protein 4A-like [Haliotis rubra]XP_046548536.1 major facilitator superfamily domain-containing protein 4A-like [Haliotis rubra]
MILPSNALKLCVWMYVLFFFGTFGSALGPSLLDLKDLFNASLLETSNLFLVLGIAEGTGCLGSMVVLKFVDANLVFMACLLLKGICIFLFAMTPHLHIACVAVGVIGVATACGYNCVVHLCNQVFPGPSSIIHGVFVASSVGSIVSPLIAEPFLNAQERAYIISPKNNATLQENDFSNQSINYSYAATPLTISISLAGDNDSCQNCSMTDSTTIAKKSQVYIVFIIIGSFQLVALLGFIISYVCERNSNSYKMNEETSSGYHNTEVEQESGGGLKTIIFYICLVSAYIPFGGLPFAYSGYLSVYGVESYLHLDIRTMASLTSAFWMLFTVGRILGTVLSLRMRQSVLIYTCLIGVLVASVAVLFLSTFGEVWLWIGSMAVGLFTGPLLPASLAWCRTCVTLTPVVTGICTFGNFTGIFLLQYITGQVVGYFGVDWYLYFIIFLSLFELMLFVVLTVLGNCIK